MTEIHFIQQDGQRRSVQAEDGLSLMVAAVENEISGIDANCNGCCSCGTCHVVVALDDLIKIPPSYSGEQQVLDCLDNIECGSRLSCQVIVSPMLNGINVTVKD